MQSVTIHNKTSMPRLFSYGVPQVSVSGPLLFTLYAAPIASIVREKGLIAHLYADDTQPNIVLWPGCYSRHKGIHGNAIIRLKLNDDKTLSLLLRTLSLWRLPIICEIFIGDNNITQPLSARSLGAIFLWAYYYGGACQQCLPLFFFPPAQHQQHLKSAGYDDTCYHCPTL